ncbi:MAG TPA: PqiC family protein, partial [Candidatus Binataceae bacterium]|nr:PqiC family protein [Candidatus Binataceae bacterium]
MLIRVARILPAAFIVAAISACGTSAPARFYSLETTAVSAGARPVRAAVMVGDVTVPASVDQPQFVVQTAPNRVELEDFNRWDSPLENAIARAVAGDLTILLGTPDVAAAPMADFKADYQVSIQVQRFESIRGQAAALDAVWTVRRVADGKTRTGRTTARESVQGQGFEVLAAAHSRALG